MNPPVFWLFCTVIDHFGDIGVTWRLARELRQRFHARVFIWLDDFTALSRIAPDWRDSGIGVLAWKEGENINIDTAPQPNIVIETFACRLPENVLRLIQKTDAVWLNWEYLSAEDWAVRSHLMPSVQASGARKYFWQMGFLPETGGLLREMDYDARQAAFTPDSLEGDWNWRWFIFAYANPVWVWWAQCWLELGLKMHIQLADKHVFNTLKNHGFLSERHASGNLKYTTGDLTWQLMDFVPQPDFDAHFWRNDVCIVRGEDSFVRAQWAGKPFFWHIYPQELLVHLDKLSAFWRLPQAQYSDSAFQNAFDALSGELNGAHILDKNTRKNHWLTLYHERESWQKQARLWQQYLRTQSDAITRLANFLSLPLVNKSSDVSMV